jgi:hypothetical protein
MTHKLKSQCTPEEWAAHLEYHRARRLKNVEEERARRREYAARPEVQAARRLRDAQPEARAARQERDASTEAKARARELRLERVADPGRQESRMDRQRARRTGIHAALFAKLLEEQGNACAVCRRSFDGRQVRRDHCHDSGAPRGLLCHHCNIVEGMLKSMALDPLEFAHRLASYLASPPADRVK